MGCTNFTLLQVESKFEGQGILSTMVDVFNLCSFHAVVYSHPNVPLESWNFFLVWCLAFNMTEVMVPSGLQTELQLRNR